MSKERLTGDELRVIHELRMRIGRLQRGDELGTAEKIAADHGIDADKIIKIMRHLVDDRLITRQQVTGIFSVDGGRRPIIDWNRTRRLFGRNR